MHANISFHATPLTKVILILTTYLTIKDAVLQQKK